MANVVQADETDGRTDPLTAELRKLREQLEKLALFNPFACLDICEAELKMLTVVWQGHKENDKDWYNYDSMFDNLFTFINIKLDCNTNLDKNCHDPNDFMAQLNKVYLLKMLSKRSEALEVLTELVKGLQSEVASESTLGAVLRANLAHLRIKLGPAHYMPAIDILARSLSGVVDRHLDVDSDDSFWYQKLFRYWESLDELDEADPMKNRIVLWAFLFGETSSKMMRRKHSFALYNYDRGNLDLEKFYTKIHFCFMFVVQTKNEMLAGRAYTELALAYILYQEKTSRSPPCSLPDNMTADECMRKALAVSPNNPHVLLLAGKHLGRTASSMEELNEAEKYLVEVTNRTPTKHVAHHHLGLVYKKKWHIAGGYPQAKIYSKTDITPETKKKKVPTATLR